MHATIIENSLADKEILKKLTINKTYTSDTWILHEVEVNESLIPELAKSLSPGPWYIHLWKKGSPQVTVIYREKIFTINHADKDTWKDAIEYGKSLGIPEEQLDFPIE